MALRSCSSSFSYGFTYDVFLSFRGEDTRYGFTGNLYKSLCDKGIRTFIDDNELQRGDEITSALEKAIKESRIFIIVLSQNYASSSFCLNELTYILKLIKEKGLLVFPVFHDVDPSHVRRNRGRFGVALANHEKNFNAYKKDLKDNMEKLEEWKMALHEVANLSGYHFKHGDGYEYKFIKRIVELISSKINRVPLPVAEYPVGLEWQVLKVKSLMDVGSDNIVHMVGIHGLGGIGKTALAIAVYNSLADHFEGLCFLEKVRETSNKHGLQHLQSNFLCEIVGEKQIKLTSVKQGISIIQQRLQRKKVLLILDDVDNQEQLHAIVGRPEWFGPGSRVIITTRDKQLLACHGVKRMYEVKELNKKDALQLLSWKAFKLEKIEAHYEDVLNRALTYASGLPLALEVIGSNLFGKNIEQWKSALNQYERIPDKKILEILKVSYDALEEDEQNVFLDIACCFKECELVEVQDILHAHHGNCMRYHIGVLIEKSLIKISLDDKVTLHDLIEDMGKEIVRKESPKDPGKRSRLWFPKDIIHVLGENKGTSEIEIIFMDFSIFEKEVEWEGDAFKKMKNLKTLIIRNGHFSKGPIHLPNSLRVLEWWEYPSQYFPDDFLPEELAICKLRNSCFTSLGLAALLLKKKFLNLTSLNFDQCQYLTEIPDVSCLKLLKKLSFQMCKNLSTIHYSVGILEKLKILGASSCGMLKSFPPLKLISLEKLTLSFCNDLESFPEILVKMENITELELRGTAVKDIPPSLRIPFLLQKLNLHCYSVSWTSFCDAPIFIEPELTQNSASRWDGLVLNKKDEGAEKVNLTMSSKVQYRNISSGYLSDDFFTTFLPYFTNVKKLDLSLNNFTVIPECIKECSFLTMLDLDYCVRLREIRGIPPNLKYFSAKKCLSLTSSCTSMLLNQELHEAGNTFFYLPVAVAEVPKWLERQTKGPSISFWFRNKFPTVAICVFTRPFKKYIVPTPILCTPSVIINGNKHVCKDFWMEINCTCLFDLQEIKVSGNLDEALLENKWNHAEITFTDFKSVPVLIKWGIHVLKQQSSMEDIQFTDPCRKRKLDNLNKVPKWIERQTWAQSISFWFSNKLPVVAVHLIMRPINEDSVPSHILFAPIVIINGNKQVCRNFWMETDFTRLGDPQEIEVSFDLDEALLENEWNHAEITFEDFKSVSMFIKWGIYVLKQQSSMEDIRFISPYKRRKTDDDLNSSESQDQQLLKKRRLVNMEDAETQFLQQQQHMGFLSRMWNWALVLFFISCCSSNQ